jgi:hypothetical protein
MNNGGSHEQKKTTQSPKPFSRYRTKGADRRFEVARCDRELQGQQEGCRREGGHHHDGHPGESAPGQPEEACSKGAEIGNDRGEKGSDQAWFIHN